MFKPHGRHLSVVVLSLALAACRDDATSPEHQIHAPQVVRQSVARGGVALRPDFDELGDSIATAVPGFGGFYVDEQRHLVVWASDVAKGPAIRQQIARWFRDPQLASLPITVKQGTYDVRDLRAWRVRLEIAMVGELWISADIDEKLNRLSVGVKDLITLTRIAAKAESAGIPAGALNLFVQDHPTLAQTPDNKQINTGLRPIPGGVNIGKSLYGFYCTLGFIVRLDTTSTDRYAVTNAHCTDSLAWNNNTTFYQYSTPTFRENDEAPFTTSLSHGPTANPCGVGYKCRYADAVLIKFDSAYSGVAFGKIARTKDSTYTYAGGAASTSLDTLVSPYPSYDILSETTMGSLNRPGIVGGSIS